MEIIKEKVGNVFSIAADNPPVRGCTISKEIYAGRNRITYFSLAVGTDISAEIHPYYKLIIIADGNLELFGTDGFRKNLRQEDCILTPTDLAVGMRTQAGVVYTEAAVRKEDMMNDVIKVGEVFRLTDLVPYQEGKIVNMDILHNENIKFAVMAFDAGSGLAEHAAPDEALVFALDGEAVIGYEGREYPIRAGENFHFAKGGLHFVKADSRFKMALLLTL